MFFILSLKGIPVLNRVSFLICSIYYLEPMYCYRNYGLHSISTQLGQRIIKVHISQNVLVLFIVPQNMNMLYNLSIRWYCCSLVGRFSFVDAESLIFILHIWNESWNWVSYELHQYSTSIKFLWMNWISLLTNCWKIKISVSTICVLFVSPWSEMGGVIFLH